MKLPIDRCCGCRMVPEADEMRPRPRPLVPPPVGQPRDEDADVHHDADADASCPKAPRKRVDVEELLRIRDGRKRRSACDAFYRGCNLYYKV